MGQGPCASLCTKTASEYHIYEWPQPIATQIHNDARPKIVDAPLTPICHEIIHNMLSFDLA